jgi:two-component system sensor histidine kinase TtrS
MMAEKPSYEELQKRVRELEDAKTMQLTRDKALEKLFNLSLDLLCVADFDGYFRIINASFENTLGHSEQVLLETPFIEFVHPDDKVATRAASAITTHELVSYFENRYRCKDGTYKWLAWTSVPVVEEGYMYAVARDITERKQAEEEIQRYQRDLAHIMRLGTMGEMASGMAHELNQPLTALVSYCGTAVSLVNSLSSPPQQLCEILERATKQAHRAGDIIRHLREFVSKGDDHKELFEIDKVIRGIIIFIKHEVQKSDLKIEFYPGCQTCKVKADKIQIDQVLINILRNSMEAIGNAKITEGRVVLQTRLLPNDSVEVTVTDNGPGIDTEMVDMIFHPFQTSKDTGMGIGLSLSRRIIEAHGGKLWVDKDYQNGALFGFELPVSM